MDQTALAEAERSWASLAADLARAKRGISRRHAEMAAREVVEFLFFLHVGQSRGLFSGRQFGTAPSPRVDGYPEWRDWASTMGIGPGSPLFEAADTVALPESLSVDGETWKTFLGRLGKVDFKSLPLETLGRLHERLLGLRLRHAGAGHWEADRHGKARKARGIFYTPRCVTRYIVDRAVLPAETSPNGSPRFCRVLDPACGSGAFLLTAFRRLCHLRQARDRDQRRRILAKSIHGVDVDPGAVLAARRALWLEMISGNSRSSPSAPVRVAETVAKNIRCDDVLTAPAWETSTGTFDVVLGNPPYRRERGTKTLLDPLASTPFGRRWRTARMDLWYYFAHRALELLRPGGVLSFIVSSYWAGGAGAEKLVRRLETSAHIDEIFCLDEAAVFPGVAGRHLIFRLTKEKRGAATTTVKRPRNVSGTPLEAILDGQAPVARYVKTPDQLFRQGRLDLEPPADALLAKIDQGIPLDRFGLIRQGIAENPAWINRRTNLRFGERWTLGEGVFSLTDEEVERLALPPRERALLRPYHVLGDLGRYRMASHPSRWLIYATGSTWPEADAMPALRDHLARFRAILEARRETRLGRRGWWHLHWPREEALWRADKVISIQMASRPAFVPARRPAYVPFSANVFVPRENRREHLHYYAAVLNSRLLGQWYRHHAKQRGVGLEINGKILARTPIRPIDFSDTADRKRHDRLVELVDKRLRLPTAELEREIDELVFALYGLGEEAKAVCACTF